jgi:citrate lyase subunit beta/citryl-CoA lyase
VGTEVRRPVALRRAWLFVAGADAAALEAAPASGADVLIQELEDFTRTEDRPAARALARDLYERWRRAGAVAAVRINPLSDCGLEDLAAVMLGRPDVVMLPKASRPGQIEALDEAITRHERRLGFVEGSTEIVPNIEGARGLVEARAILGASRRVTAALVASEDMANDLGSERSATLAELEHVRERFHLECVAAGVLSIDMPWTWADVQGARNHALSARRIGYRAKSAVNPSHVPEITAVLTPQAEELVAAQRIVEAFEQARAQGAARAMVDGIEVEVPTYRNAVALLERAAALSAAPLGSASAAGGLSVRSAPRATAADASAPGPSLAFWQERFESQRTPWDRGEANPALLRLLAEQVLATGSRVLVPGCGAGHEALAFAAAGMRVTAVDYAPAAVALTRARFEQANLPGTIVEADLLAWEAPRAPEDGSEGFDAIWDQACLCALHPDFWAIYARRLAGWLRPGGRLFLLAVQVEREGRREGRIEGPPYHCDVNLVRALFPSSSWQWPKPPYRRQPHPAGFSELEIVLTRRGSAQAPDRQAQAGSVPGEIA